MLVAFDAEDFLFCPIFQREKGRAWAAGRVAQRVPNIHLFVKK